MNEYDVVVRRRPRGAESYEEHLRVIAQNKQKAVSAAKRGLGPGESVSSIRFVGPAEE